jgi:hypothetical protein
MPVAPAPEAPPTDPVDSIIVVPAAVARRGGAKGKRGASRGPSARVTALVVLLVGVLGVAVVTGLGIAGQLPAPLSSWWSFLFATGGNGPTFESRKQNFSFRTPDRPWMSDQDVKIGLKADLAMRRSSPNRWLAIIAKDFKDRNPRDSDLIDEAANRLRGYFQDMEYSQPVDAQIAGKKARAIEFQGVANNVQMNGECVLLAHQGFGYWFLTWAPMQEKENASEEWRDLRERFVLLKEREGWQEGVRKQITFAKENSPYTLRYAESIWEKQDPGGLDEATDLALLGSDPSEQKHASRTANVEVLLLPAKDDFKDAAADALAHVKKMYTAGGYPDTTMTVLSDKDGDMDRKQSVGDREGQITHFQVRNGENRERYVLLAVVPLPEKIVAIHCECDLQRRDYWQQEFLTLVESFRVRPAK